MTQAILDDLVRLITGGLEYLNESENYKDLVPHLPSGVIEERARNIAQSIVCRYELKEVSFDPGYAHRPEAKPVNDRRQEERRGHKGNTTSLCCDDVFVFDRGEWKCRDCWGMK